jgi:hypothetical protein
MGRIYKILTAAQYEGAISLGVCDMEFEGAIPFAIHTYYEREGHCSKQRIELDPLKLQAPRKTSKWKFGGVECDFFYQGLVVFPTPRDN